MAFDGNTPPENPEWGPYRHLAEEAAEELDPAELAMLALADEGATQGMDLDPAASLEEARRRIASSLGTVAIRGVTPRPPRSILILPEEAFLPVERAPMGITIVKYNGQQYPSA